MAVTGTPKPAPSRRMAGPLVALLLAVPLNAALGAIGYLPYILTTHLVDVVRASLGLTSLQAGVPPFVLVAVLAGLWGLYIPLLVSSNRAIVRRTSMPTSVYLAVAGFALLMAFGYTALRLWGFVLS
jgi:hypothetical protein